jgi:hypothetical protein
MTLSLTVSSVIMLSVAVLYCYAESQYGECRYAECCYAECRYADSRGASLKQCQAASLEKFSKMKKASFVNIRPESNGFGQKNFALSFTKN